MLVQAGLGFNLLFRPGLRKDFRDSFEQFDPEYPSYLRVGTTSVPEQSATIMAGPNRLYERGDGEAVQYDIPRMGPKVSGIDKEFASGFMLTRRTVEDDQYGKANQASRWLAEAARLTYEYRSAALLDDAFTGTDFKGIDSLPLCHTTHTLINSASTVANRPSTEVGLSITGITAMLDLFMVMKNENGDPIRMFPDTLILGNNSGDYHRALQIFNSQLEPFTAENQENAIRMRLPKPKLVISHYKASSKSYFMVDSRWNDAWFLVRRPVSFEDTFDFDTDVMKAKASTRFMIWFVDWRGWVGANPS